MVGVYSIHNSQKPMQYIGSSIDIYDRWVAHKKNLRSNTHINSKLQNAWNKYGESSFNFYVLEILPDNSDKDTIFKTEQKHIDVFNFDEDLYNLNPKAGGPPAIANSKSYVKGMYRNEPVKPRYCRICGAQIYLTKKYYRVTCGSQACIRETSRWNSPTNRTK